VPNLSYLSPKTVVKESPIHGRGMITGQDWWRKDLQEKYRGYIVWYLQPTSSWPPTGDLSCDD
jgi:hypothetical protein